MIWNILRNYLAETLRDMERDRVKVRIMGDRTGMPDDIRDILRKIDEKNALIDGITLVICLNYGGRDEILQAVRKTAVAIKSGDLSEDDVTEEFFESQLYSVGIPDPDLVIRPSGEMRTSNFLIWQAAYAELYFTPVLWPDFDIKEMDKAIDEFRRRDRRYGGIGK